MILHLIRPLNRRIAFTKSSTIKHFQKKNKKTRHIHKQHAEPLIVHQPSRNSSSYGIVILVPGEFRRKRFESSTELHKNHAKRPMSCPRKRIIRPRRAAAKCVWVRASIKEKRPVRHFPTSNPRSAIRNGIHSGTTRTSDKISDLLRDSAFVSRNMGIIFAVKKLALLKISSAE